MGVGTSVRLAPGHHELGLATIDRTRDAGVTWFIGETIFVPGQGAEAVILVESVPAAKVCFRTQFLALLHAICVGETLQRAGASQHLIAIQSRAGVIVGNTLCARVLANRSLTVTAAICKTGVVVPVMGHAFA